MCGIAIPTFETCHAPLWRIHLVEVKLAILEANIVKEPMKCKHAHSKLGKLSQHLSIESYANKFQNLCA